ncbi:LysR family transcriptional regulator, nitrogen assimilation regulatory protein [Variovorax sp. HW608]|uniref:LysR substrate-binding domain-containing protein n=1 Tax=Variovorax sp. HW608 TaxID=1034889 RepID=UPI00081FC486|nr:LysR substrate-binding domain-containing protein [Variovorax sp. HW608]SCK10212.1 LysR family transcriptional regulator, nitrogen assimilation regulatory protein [Variovorax sp. HW608]
MDLRQLRYFIAIVDCGSLSKAAERLHIAQPSLSQQIAAMESELSVPILLRSSQGVAATQAGMTLYRHARQVLRQLEQLRVEVGQAGEGEVGTVTIGLPTSVAAIVAVPLYRAVRLQHPGIRLNIIESMSGNLMDLLASQRLDLAVLFREVESRGVAVLPLLRDSLAIYGVESMLTRAGKRLNRIHDLDGVPLVLPGPSNGLRIHVEKLFARSGTHLNVVADIDALPTLIAIVAEGAACTVLSEALGPMCGPAIATGIRLEDSGADRPVSLCWSTASAPNSAVDAVRRIVAAVCAQAVDDGSWAGAHRLDL